MERKPEKWIIKDERGRRPGQKYKSLLVIQYILKNADDENAVTMDEILNHLTNYGITAERHSIKRNIDDIFALLNKEITGFRKSRRRSGWFVSFWLSTA